MQKYECSICGYVYDESAGIPQKGISPGTKWGDLPDDFVCPLCSAPKSAFHLLDEKPGALPIPSATERSHSEKLTELSAGEISAICSNLAKGCEKQRLLSEMEAFYKLADFFKAKAAPEPGDSLTDVAKMLSGDMQERFVSANMAAKAAADRGALRSLVWSEKVSTMAMMLLERFAKEGEAMLKDARIFVCDICGFIYLGDTLPDICPVCKVPNFRMTQIERGGSYASV